MGKRAPSGPSTGPHAIAEALDAVLLTTDARLAVDRRHQRRGLGRALVSDAARRTLEAAEAIGGRALVVHAASPVAATFYANLGFDRFPTDPLHLGILLKDLRRRYWARRREASVLRTPRVA